MKNFHIAYSTSILGQVSDEDDDREVVVAAENSVGALHEFLLTVVLAPGEEIHYIHVGPGKRIPPTSPIGNM